MDRARSSRAAVVEEGSGVVCGCWAPVALVEA